METPEQRRQAVKATDWGELTEKRDTGNAILNVYMYINVSANSSQERDPLLPGVPPIDAGLEDLCFHFVPVNYIYNLNTHFAP